MRKPASVLKICLTAAAILTAVFAHAEDYDIAPMKLQGPIFMKILGLNNQIVSGGDVTIHVIGSPEFADEIKKKIGQKIGRIKLVAVNGSDGLPTEKPSAIYIGHPSILEEALSYSRANKIMSMTGIPGLASKGVTAGIGISDGKPRILINATAMKAEGVEFNPALFKVAKVIK